MAKKKATRSEEQGAVRETIIEPNSPERRGDGLIDSNRVGDPAQHPATDKQKIALAKWLAGGTIVSLIMAGLAFNWVQGVSQMPSEVDWKRESKVQLRTGPVGFGYTCNGEADCEPDKLTFAGVMSNETKQTLADLFPSIDDVSFDSDVADKTTQKVAYQSDAKSYRAAIDRLAAESVELANKYVMALLLLGGCCGTVGVQLRSMWDFVRNICFKHPPQLDIVTWWPWYLMRPIIGFVLGVLAISLIMSGFLEIDNQNSRGALWWLSITTLVGFGASEFMARLRLVVRALFAAEG
jgi:hypothetical protein